MGERFVYRLDVTYPDGSDAPGWEPEGWEAWSAPYSPEDDGRFVWPRVRPYLSRSGAEKRANLLRSYGATVTVVQSNPVTWPGEGGCESCGAPADVTLNDGSRWCAACDGAARRLGYDKRETTDG